MCEGIVATKLYLSVKLNTANSDDVFIDSTINSDPFSSINLSFWFQVDILALYVCAPFSSIGPKVMIMHEEGF